MPRPPAAARTLAPVDPPMSNGCAQVEAEQALAAAGERIAAALEALMAPGEIGKDGKPGPSIVERFASAADEIHDLGQAQKKLCSLLVKHRLKLVTGGLGGFVAVGAISPNAAHVIEIIAKGFGLQ